MQDNEAFQNFSQKRASIRLLPQRLVNQIAAGEVIERPSSVIKELVENAIDAEATEITVEVVNGGKNFISVADNGSGMDKDSLKMCILSHATSKLSSENLFDIHTFGFRGEALPSIASVSRLSVITSDNEEGEAWKMQMEGQEEVGNISPANRSKGTTLEIRDLFFATPARLKFLKSDSYETERCRSIFDDIALANPSISFKFVDSGCKKAYYKRTDDISQRIKDIFGDSFFENMFEIDTDKDKDELSNYINGDLSLKGFMGVPTFNRSASNQQYFFVNGRLVKDKTMSSALRSAYAGLIPHGRYPVAVLFLKMPYNEVDVNVHPAKTEVRFKNAERIRNFMASELKRAIELHGSNRSTTEIMHNFYKNAIKVPTKNSSNLGNGNALGSSRGGGGGGSGGCVEFDDRTATAVDIGSIEEVETEIVPDSEQAPAAQKSAGIFQFPLTVSASTAQTSRIPSKHSFIEELAQIEMENGIGDIGDTGPKPETKTKEVEEEAEKAKVEATHDNQSDNANEIHLGNAAFQVNNTYIVAESDEGIIVVDQHAAAERIMLQELKKNPKMTAQNLLIPEKMKIGRAKVELLKKYDDLLAKLGLYIEYGDDNNSGNAEEGTIVVSAIPAILETSDVVPLMNDVIDELSLFGDVYTLDDKIHKILSTMACHSSLRAGKKLSIQEMNYLLRRMELTDNIAQCCHGRPSYIKLSIKDLNIFFERT